MSRRLRFFLIFSGVVLLALLLFLNMPNSDGSISASELQETATATGINSPQNDTQDIGISEVGEELATTNALENTARTEETSEGRNEIRQFGSIAVHGVGDGVIADIWCMQINADVRRALTDNPFLRHSELRELSPPTEYHLKQGDALYSGDFENGNYFVWVRCPGNSIEFKHLDLPLVAGDCSFEMRPCLPLRVRVLDEEGNPLAGAEIMYFGPKGDPAYMDWGWQKRLEASFFLEFGETGPDGRAQLLSPLPANNMIEVAPKSGLCGGNNLNPSLEHENVVVLSPACTVSGKLLDSDDNAVLNSYVGFMGASEGHEVFLTSTPVDEEGNYSISVVPSSHDQLQVIGFAEGYTMGYATISRPDSNGSYHRDFVIHQAVSLNLRLTSKGQPVANAAAFFAVDELEDVPGYYQSDNNGIITTDRVFRGGSDYLLQLVSGSLRLGVYPFRVPLDSTEVVELEVDPVGTLRLVDEPASKDDQAIGCRFRSQAGHVTGFIEWDPREGVPPLVPVGQGRLVCRTVSGGSWSRDLFVESGINHISPPARQAPFIFTLPESETPGIWGVSLFTDGEFPDRELELLVGRHELQVTPGAMTLLVQSPDGGSWQLGPIRVSESGLNLGTLRAQNGSVNGLVADENGEPWSGLQVSLVDSEMRPEQRAFTDSEGYFSFHEVPYGFHTVHIRPRRSLLLNVPDQHTEIQVGSDGPTEVMITVQANSSLRGQVVPPPSQPTEVWVVSGSVVQEQSLAASGKFAFSSVSRGWLVAGCFGMGEMNLVGVKIEEGDDAVLDFGSCETTSLSFVEADGADAANARVQLELAGSLIAGAASLNEEGQLELRHSRGLPIAVIVTDHSGGRHRFSSADLATGESLYLGEQNESKYPLLVRDIAGYPISFATVSSSEYRQVWHSDINGECTTSGLSSPGQLVVQCSGFWKAIVADPTALKSQEVVLRRTAAPTSISCSGFYAVADVQVEAMFELGYEFPITVETTAARTWSVSDVPEGRYQVAVFDRNGVVVDMMEVELRAGDPREIQLH